MEKPENEDILQREQEKLDQGLEKQLMVGLILIIVLILIFPVYWLREPFRLKAAAQVQREQTLANGKKLYGTYCAACHGIKGEGINAPALNAQEFLNNVTDKQIGSMIQAGIPGTSMPAWSMEFGGPLTDQEIEDIVAFLRSWEETASSRPDWRTPGETAGEATGEEAGQEVEAEPEAKAGPDGAELFAAKCASCHGEQGSSGFGPPLDATGHLSDHTDKEIEKIILEGQPDKGMPAWKGQLSQEEITAIVEFLRELQ